MECAPATISTPDIASKELGLLLLGVLIFYLACPWLRDRERLPFSSTVVAVTGFLSLADPIGETPDCEGLSP